MFDNGVQYTFIKQNKSIYYNSVKICRGIEECTFSKGIKNGNDIVTVHLEIEGKIYENEYTLKK